MVPIAFDVYEQWRLLVDMALSEAGRRRLLSRWLAQWAVAVRRRNFEVYRDCLAGSELGSQEQEREVIDLVAGPKGMQWGSQREAVQGPPVLQTSFR